MRWAYDPGRLCLKSAVGQGLSSVGWSADTNGANHITGVDINSYSLREAAALAKKEGSKVQ